jgi:hypothetical protein
VLKSAGPVGGGGGVESEVGREKISRTRGGGDANTKSAKEVYMPDHPVKRKLRNDILPTIVSAKQLRKQWFCRVNFLFVYATDIIVALTALGLSSPWLVFLQAKTQSDNSKQPSLSEILAATPQWLYYPAIVLVVAWIFLRVTFSREDGQKRAILAKSCAQTFRQANGKLFRMLSKPNPMPDLNKLLDEEISPTVDKNIQEKVWPWDIHAPGIAKEVETELADLCSRFEVEWSPVDPGGLRIT